MFIMSKSNVENKIKKTFLTPCRQVGLKRKSIGNTPRSCSADQSPSVSNTNENSSVSTSRLDADNNITPVRHIVDDDSNSKLEKKIKLDLLKSKKIFTESSTAEEKTDELVVEDDIQSQIKRIERNITEMEVKIDELKIESTNAKQHDLNTLYALIKKWRSGCQAALKELLGEYQSQGKNCTMPILLKSLGIPFELVHYSEKEMDFTD